ncbi:MAG: tetratricopeptide repeat protein [Kiritimatiellia bacterium]
MKTILACLICASCGALYADFEADMLAAAQLQNENKYDEAIAAWINIGNSCADPDQQFDAIRKAAECARLNKGGEARALEICANLKTEPYGQACRAVVYQWTAAHSNVIAEFEGIDFAGWPEELASVAYRVRAQAYYSLKNGRGAAHDYLKAFQCSRHFDKWTSLRMLGNTYLNLLGDEITAEACFRKCVADCGGGHPGLSAKVDLVNLLMAQKRYADALKCLVGDKHGGSWEANLTAMEGKVYAAMGKKAEAISAYEKALKVHGIQANKQKECEKAIAELRGIALQPPDESAKKQPGK